MDDQGCPRCKTTKYRNPSLKLLVNVCGHSLCESCVDLLFIKGSGACPECNTALRRNNFRLQLFEDAYVEKEVDIRKKVLRDFNKKEEDFATLREYNDYLEQLETIVFNLANNIEVEATKKMIDNYKKENKEIIQKNKSKLSKDEEYLEQLIAHEEEEAKQYKQMVMENEMREKNLKKRSNEALIEELMFSNLPASAILAEHQKETEKAMDTTAALPKQSTGFSTGVRMGFSQEGFIPVPSQEEIPAYEYTPCILEMCGPRPPMHSELEDQGFMRNVREASNQEKGGGYEARMACQRALVDALSGLFHFQDPSEFAAAMAT